jgi:MFS family permease
MDMSSELIHSLLPVFMVSVLGASFMSVGIIEGLAEGTAMVLKVFSGMLSDYWKKRKLLAVIGYGLAAVTKPLFPMASHVSEVFFARLLDRIGKGIRGAPRDALIADLAPVELRGTCYGLRQTLDTIGAFLGPLLAMVLMALLADNIRMVLWVAVIPAVLAVMFLMVGVREPTPVQPGEADMRPQARLTFPRLGRLYWWIVMVGGILTLARFSEAFLVLRAEHAGLALTFLPLVMVIMSVAYAASAYPAGVFADRENPRYLLVAGFIVLILADVILAYASGVAGVMAGVALWGIHMGLTQGLLVTLIAGAAPAEHRGSAFGLFNLVSGLTLFVASLLAGFLWDQFGPSATFLAGAGFTALALMGILVHWPIPSRLNGR